MKLKCSLQTAKLTETGDESTINVHVRKQTSLLKFNKKRKSLLHFPNHCKPMNKHAICLNFGANAPSYHRTERGKCFISVPSLTVPINQSCVNNIIWHQTPTNHLIENLARLVHFPGLAMPMDKSPIRINIRCKSHFFHPFQIRPCQFHLSRLA
ncbi:hypothetical protein QJS10_CPB11g00398 [Acorus calamus]|uniref:Uncharacterized protein n=1 Tax=Acorus calamus TaxID=4465 RepID=A0AAV9DVP3_ACOCL|nr:hypothetical protein QJS10_CPB11g00398 [Acorus calamus]